MKANSEKTKQSKKATRRVLAGVLCGASVLSLVLSLVMPPISQAIANDAQMVSTEKTVTEDSSTESTGVENANNGDAKNQNSDETENGASEGTVAADSTADGAEVKGAEQPSDAQPSDNENSDENAIAPVSAKDYQEVKDDVAHAFDNGGKFQLTGSAYSNQQIKITKDTTIDLNGNMLYHGPGSVESFIVVQDNATLTIEDSAKVSDATSPVTNNPGQLAEMKWTGDNNGTPQSLTYYETTSTPHEDKLGTTETTTEHVVSGFGAIVAASEGGSVKRVISVAKDCTLNLNGGMITTPRILGNDGHVIFSQGAVNISGGYVTNGSCGGWGGGLCVTGADANLVMTGGVIAGNKAASGGGIYADNGATLKLSGGVISGNATYSTVIYNDDVKAGGYGGGVYTQGASVTISDSANITNNRAEARASAGFYNKGRLGGGGIASMNGGTLSMTGGSVTANYSYEAGGGIYAGFPGQGFGFTMYSGFIAGNKSDNAEGGGLRISGGTTGVIGASNTENASNRVYITNNETMTGSNKDRGGDWGGGGVFVQEGGTLNIVKTLITNNKAGGWGGGIGACPTGKTIVSYSKGAAIYDNADNVDQDNTPLDPPHYSAGGNGKTEDSNNDYIGDPFKNHGHKDFFLVRKNDSQNTVALVLGKMLGGESAGWQGTCDRSPVTIDPNGGAEAKYMFGLEAHPTHYAKDKAQAEATTIISGNYSYTHGGGIMTNGDLIVGEVNDLRVYPSMKLEATKALVDAEGNKQSLDGHAYKFQLLRQKVNGTKAPFWKDDGTLDMGECSVAGEADVDQTNGNITFDSGKDYSSGQYVFYLVEEPISGDNELDTKFDKTIYKIVVKVGDKPSETKNLMTYPINYYKVERVTVYKKSEGAKDFELLDGGYSVAYLSDNTMASVTIGDINNPTFTNKIEPYTSLGSWTPAATKVVKGGEMKEFTLEFADNEEFENAERRTTDAKMATTTADGDKLQELEFPQIEYTLDKLKQSNSADPGRLAGKDFQYYVRESTKFQWFSHYTYDKSVYRFDVKMKDNGEGKIEPEIVTFTKIKDAHGYPIADPKPINFDSTKPESTPTFTNTYSTSLPLSGMSGVTLTYLAGAAVLCAAAAWMHIRRKANAKGGKRCE